MSELELSAGQFLFVSTFGTSPHAELHRKVLNFWKVLKNRSLEKMHIANAQIGPFKSSTKAAISGFQPFGLLLLKKYKTFFLSGYKNKSSENFKTRDTCKRTKCGLYTCQTSDSYIHFLSLL